MAFTAITALVSGAATTTALVLGAMAEIGTIMTIVGGVTGNKDLMKLGGVIGLVGGVGGLVNGAIGGAATAAGADAAVASAGAQQTAEIAAQQVGGEAVSSAVTQGAATGASLGDLSAGISPTTGMNNPSAYSGTGPLPASNVSSAAPALQGPATQASVGDTVVQKAANLGPKAIDGPKGGNFFSNTLDFIKNPANQNLINSGIKVIGGAMQGANDADQFNQRMQFSKDQFNYETGRNANISQQNLSRSGILNGAR